MLAHERITWPERTLRNAKEATTAVFQRLAEKATLLYEPATPSIVERKNHDAYAETAALMRSVRALVKSHGRGQDVGGWLAWLRLATSSSVIS